MLPNRPDHPKVEGDSQLHKVGVHKHTCMHTHACNTHTHTKNMKSKGKKIHSKTQGWLGMVGQVCNGNAGTQAAEPESGNYHLLSQPGLHSEFWASPG